MCSKSVIKAITPSSSEFWEKLRMFQLNWVRGNLSFILCTFKLKRKKCVIIVLKFIETTLQKNKRKRHFTKYKINDKGK